MGNDAGKNVVGDILRMAERADASRSHARAAMLRGIAGKVAAAIGCAVAEERTAWMAAVDDVDADGWRSKYVWGRCLPRPRFEGGGIVAAGSATEFGEVAWLFVEDSDAGWGNFELHFDEGGDVIEGSLHQRVGKPAAEREEEQC